ncbi:3-phytase [Trichoderma simmonsii]|uniref:3-phytase n=1 Tax=Trichoderma simmonsii TaxID=1491479 RepID=A0A8G0PIY6_9HYPO|nr:3-phytase [Trichoderma simmonsii]
MSQVRNRDRSRAMSTSKPISKPGRADASDYRPVHQDDDTHDANEEEEGVSTSAYLPPRRSRADRRYRTTILGLVIALIILLATNLYLSLPYFFPGHGPGSCPAPSKVPQYFQTSPELWAGPTATGNAAFLAQTRTFDPTATFVPNEPLQTAIPVQGMKPGNETIFKMMGYLSPYFPSPGFGVNEYPLPAGAEIVQVQMLSRHGARYPTSGVGVVNFAQRIANASSDFNPKGPLGFLKGWEYHLGSEILVPKGREELYNSGVLHSYMYGSLYNPNSKIIVRTTTQDRMLKSAENWMAGFFGLEWTNNATIEVIIEASGFNNSLAGSLNCPNSYTKISANEAKQQWINTYLQDALHRFNALTDGFEWTIDDVYNAQTMCPYETVAYGFSMFCDLFTYEEWQGFGYSIDVWFSGGNAFHSPTGRAIGIGYQQEVLARLKNHTLGYSGSQINVTLDNNTETFPLNQSLYFDFSHDTNIVSILTAFGLRQFAEELPADRYPGAHNFTVAHITPFGARLDIEIIKTPKPVSPNRDGYLRGEEQKYVHFILNQRTIPLGLSFPECDADRKDGWCEFDTFVKIQEGMSEKASYDHACHGEYDKEPYGKITDGAPN